MPYVSPAAKKEADLPSPISPKREFEQLSRSIRLIAANSRAFSGGFIQELINQTDVSAKKQRNWSVAGSIFQLGIPVISLVIAVVTGQKKDEFGNWLQMGSKVGDIAQSACGATQFGYQASGQRIQQTLSHYNTFDQRMQSLMTSIESAQQRLQQKEMEEASNR